MKHLIVRNPPRPEPAAVRLLGELGVATVHEAQGRTGLLRPYMRPIYPLARVAGSALTVICQAGDNLMIHAALDVAREGDVLVVVTTSESTDGMFGSLLADSCLSHGVRGLIIDAGVRDVTELTEMNFPVWSKAISAQGTVKATPGSVNVPVVCAGMAINPGDAIVADEDGVVVVGRNAVSKVAALGQTRRDKEAQTRARLQSGELGLEIYNLRVKLSQLGVEWVDAEGEER